MLQEGNYLLSGKYTKAELMNLIKEWPQRDVKRVTLLEWRSIYDIDAYLTELWEISAGQFIQKAEDQQFIQEMKSDFPFLWALPSGKSLEGYLYPDTYFLDPNSSIPEQLIKSQLKNFNQKVWIPLGDQLQSFGYG